MAMAFLKSLIGSGRGKGEMQTIKISYRTGGRDETPNVLGASSVVSLPSGSFYMDQTVPYQLHIELPFGLHPATVIVVDEKPSVDSIQGILNRFQDVDDVINSDFFSLVIFSCQLGAHCELSGQLASYLRSIGTLRVGFPKGAAPHCEVLLEGPYFASSQGLFRVWKLVPDTYGAFVTTLVETSSKKLTNLNASSAEATPNLAVALPSRLYYPPRADKPLNGLRIAIKDNIDVSGAKTSGSCKSFGDLYGVRSHSAPAVQRLIDLGAVILGKTGMSQFADAEDPSGDFVDFHAPRNPRGDGLRVAGGSSFGSGAAAGAYDWIDFTLGTDTGGSVRQPTAHQSIFGIRPSRGAMSLEGTLIIHRDLDAIGIISKDLRILEAASQKKFETARLTADALTPKQPPTFLYPQHLFPVEDPYAQRVYDKIAVALEKTLGVRRRVIDFNEEWKKSQNFTEETLEDYFSPVLYDYIVWGQYHERAKFREDYRARYSRDPYVNPLIQFRWEKGSGMTQEHFNSIQTKREQFQDFIESIYGNNSIMLTPFKYGEPDAQDIYRLWPVDRDQAEFGWGLRPAFQTPMAGQPEIVFPVGQLPVLSSVSGVEEVYGIVASIIGSKGTDIAIIEIVKSLLESLDLPLKVLTGRAPCAT